MLIFGPKLEFANMNQYICSVTNCPDSRRHLVNLLAKQGTGRLAVPMERLALETIANLLNVIMASIQSCQLDKQRRLFIKCDGRR